MGPTKILVTSQKGGVGKSTLTANLAAYFGQFESRRVTLIDFDHQASSYTWIQRAPVAGVTPLACDIVTERDPQLAALKMKQSLRSAERQSDLVFADLTWVNIFPQSMMLDFDVVLVPTSLSKVELSSTIEFVSRFAQVFNGAGALRPRLVLVPSRLHRTQDYLDIFSQHNFPVKFSLTSPLPFELDIQSLYGQDYIFNTDNDSCRDSFFQIGHELSRSFHNLQKAREKEEHSHKVTSMWHTRPRNGAGSSVLDNFVYERRSSGSPTPLVRAQVAAPKLSTFDSFMGLLRRRS